MSAILFELNDFSVRENTLYEVTSKIDSSSPDGFRTFRTSKVLSPDVKDGYPGAIFDSNLGIWDTGLYDNSRALIKAIPSSTDRTAFVKNIAKVLVKPLVDLKGKDYLSQFKENNTFWDGFRINLYAGRVFNTERPEDLLQLFLVLLHRQVTPKPLESNPNYKNSQYCIIDKEDSVDRKMEAEMAMMEAQGTFFNLLKTKKDDLLLILDFLRLNISPKTEDRVIVSLFNNWLKDVTDGYQNSGIFIKTYKNFLTKDGEKEMFLFSKLKEAIKKNKVKTKKNEVWFDDEYIGADIKAATRVIMERAELQEILLKLTE